jgi:CO/xanthine dehydrogenase FAD-binding subunit
VAARAAHAGATVVAGGTEVMVARNRGERPGSLLDLSRVAELRAVQRDGPVVRLGAMVTLTRLIEELDEPLPCLAAAARTVASRQVRNRATIGGTVAVADPSADLLAALVATDAEVELSGPGGARTLPIERFLSGPFSHDLRRGELVSAVLVPRADGPVAYAKVGARNAMARAICAVAVALHPAARVVGICVAAAAPTPLRARAAESTVAAEAPWGEAGVDPGWLSRVGALAAEATRPRTDERGTAAYRRHAAAVLTARALGRAWAQQGTAR